MGRRINRKFNRFEPKVGNVKRKKILGANRTDLSKSQYFALKSYGMSKTDIREMLAYREPICAICRSCVELVVDHDHETGAFRDLLCFNCNVMLGHAKDSPKTLLSGFFYLKRHGIK